MKKFSSLNKSGNLIVSSTIKKNNINEARNPDAILKGEISKYINAVKKEIGKDVQTAILVANKLGLDDPESLDLIRLSTKPRLKKVAEELNIPLVDIQDLWELFKQIKIRYRQMPQYMTRVEREQIEAGKLAMSDLTIDLDTPKGRDAAAKVYMPVVMKIISQEYGKHPGMTKEDMLSSGMEAMMDAMLAWKKDPDSDDGKKVVGFRQFLAYRVKQKIANDYKKDYQTLSGRNWYNIKQDAEKYGSNTLYATSLDGLTKDKDGNDFSQDKLAGIGIEDRDADEIDKMWDHFYKKMSKKFSERDLQVFFHYFGLNGYKKMKSKDIAVQFNLSTARVSTLVTKSMIPYIQKDPTLSEILQELLELYTESLLIESIGLSKSQIMHKMISDDVYILLKEANKWNNDPDAFRISLHNALKLFGPEYAKSIVEMIHNADKGIIIKENSELMMVAQEFLGMMYPAEHITESIHVINNHFEDIQRYIKKFNIKL